MGDIARLDIYFTDDGAFTDVTGMTPYASLPADSTTLTLEGLDEFTDHYFAVVAVDALGNANPLVSYSAAYIITGELESREYSLHVGGEPVLATKELVSREFGVTMVDAEPPPVVEELVVTASAEGDQVLLDWAGYNQWAVGDIARFDIYQSDAGAIFDVTGMTPVASLPADSRQLEMDGLVPGIDHFFAVVAVDGLGNSNPLVDYAG